MARGLNVERVVAAAIELADEEGLAAVSMARVAKRCGFTTMSLYRHVASKDELVWRMLDSALGPGAGVRDPGLADRPRALGARAARRAAARTRGASTSRSPASSRPFSQVSWLDRGLQALDGTGLQPGEDADLVLLVNGYVFWAVRLETSLAAAPPEPLVPVEFDLDAVPYRAPRVRVGRLRGRATPRTRTSPRAWTACWTGSAC